MSREVLYQGLSELPVIIEDTSKNSLDYFRINSLPTELTAGKNLFSFSGNPYTFADGSPLYVEVVDSTGTPIYTEVSINAESDDQFAIVSIFVDNTTAPGAAEIILCGTVDTDADGNPVNTTNGVNIRWSTPIQIYPSKRNTSNIVFNRLPLVTVSASKQNYVDYFYPGNGSRFTSSLYTGLNYLLYNNTPILLTSSLSTPFTSDIVSGTIYISSSNIQSLVPNTTNVTTVLSESIVSVINSGSLVLANPLEILQYNSNAFNEFKSATITSANVIYEQQPISSSSSSNYYNLITVNFSELQPIAGTVSRIKSYYKQISVGEYVLFNESDITVLEPEYGYTTGSLTLRLPLYDIVRNSDTDFKFEFINPDGTPSNQIVVSKNHLMYDTCCGGDSGPNGPNYSIQFNNSGSFGGSGNFTLVGNNSVNLSGSLIISGSTTGSPTASVQIFGDIRQTGYHRFDPVNTNINTSISASYIYVSGSTNDLYFSQNSAGYNNVTRLRWIEGNLYTGLLHGGLITTQSSTVYQIASGSGVIVNLNASIPNDPYPIVQYLNWSNLSASIAPLSASYDQSFVAVDSTNNITAQGTPYNDGDYNVKIPIGIVLHQNHSTINAVQTFPSVAYGWKQRSFDFIKAFGPLKISGYVLSPSGSSTGSLVLSGGTSWVDGRNYTIDPTNPSYIVESTGIITSKIYRYYQSGSQWVYNTNNAAGYAAIDPTKYALSGSLSPVASNDWSIQRVFYFPNSATKALYIYYGNTTYPNKTDAIAGILTEPFNEAPNTAANAIFVGYMLLRNDANFTTAASYEFRSTGLFRAAGGGGSTSGGGGGITSPGGLNTQIQYNNVGTFSGVPTLTYNGTSISATGSFSGSLSGTLIGTASWAHNVISASYAPDTTFPFNGNARISGSLTVTGSVIVSGSSTFTNIGPAIFSGSVISTVGFTGSFSGSFNGIVNNAISSSFASTASFVQLARSSSFASTASYIQNAISSSFATTANSVPAYETAWTSYGIIWSSAGVPPNLGDGTLVGYYKQIGKTVFVRVKLNWGSTTTGGTGHWLFSLPVPAASPDGIQFPCSMLNNGFAWYQGTVNGTYAGHTDKTAIIGQAPGANSSQGVDSTFPIGWGVADSLQFNGSYEAL